MTNRLLGNLRIDHNNVITHCILPKLHELANVFSHSATSVKVEVDMAAFFKALVGVENVPVSLKPVIVEPPSIVKVTLAESTVNALGVPFVVFFFQG